MNSKLVIASALALIFSVTAYASPQQQEEEQGELYSIHLDWSDKRTLSDSVVQMCDDSYYRAVEVVIPGKPYENFTVEMSADVTGGKVDLGCSYQIKKGPNSTTFTFDAVSGSCQIRVNKVRTDLKEKPQSAEYEVHDAC